MVTDEKLGQVGLKKINLGKYKDGNAENYSSNLIVKNEKIKSDTLGSPLHPSQSIHGAKPSIGKKKRSWPLAGPPLLFMTQLRAAAPVSCVIFVIIFSFFFRCQNASVVPQCLKVTEKVSFNIVSEASYVYILSGQKLIENGQFWQVFEKPDAYGQTVLPDRSILIGQKWLEKAKIEKFKCDILGDFQTLCSWSLGKLGIKLFPLFFFRFPLPSSLLICLSHAAATWLETSLLGKIALVKGWMSSWLLGEREGPCNNC